jgi:SEC-C motif-containing protein
MPVDPSPNDPCPCGSGKKFKNCHMHKKPRKWSINVQFQEPVTTLGIGTRPDGTIQYFSDGAPINPGKVDYETIYDRKNKKKVIHKLDLDPTQITDNPDLSLRKFDLIYAIDTNTKAGNGNVISVATVVLCKLDFAADGTINYQYGPIHSLEFWNIKDHPENVAWMKVIQFITQDQSYYPGQKIGMIVDSDLGNLAAFNARALPIYADFYLPENFELLYASAEVGTEEFLLNHLIALSEVMAKSLLTGILLNKASDTNPREVNDEPYTHFRHWSFSGFPQENETGPSNV